MPDHIPKGRYSANPYAIDGLIIGSIVRLVMDHPGSPVLNYILERIYPYHLVQTEHLIIMASIHRCHAAGQPLTMDTIREDLSQGDPAGFCRFVLDGIVEIRDQAPVDFEQVEDVVQDLIIAQRQRESSSSADLPAKLTGVGSYHFKSPTMEPIQLHCGRTVKVDAVIYGRNYRGWLQNERDLEMIEGIIQEAVDWSEREWHLATRLIKPEVDMSDPRHPRIPLVQIAVRLLCEDALKAANGEGSGLSLVWFVEDQEFKQTGLAQLIRQAVTDVPWDEWARDLKNSSTGSS